MNKKKQKNKKEGRLQFIFNYHILLYEIIDIGF